ncbi:MAG: hypothetical protein R6V72_06980 [Cyclobacterium sp.]|uniref:hypothetical protein n=1 Tax=Cyclobacterium sp. TaxID=1966343 RepID=UPI003970A6EB
MQVINVEEGKLYPASLLPFYRQNDSKDLFFNDPPLSLDFEMRSQRYHSKPALWKMGGNYDLPMPPACADEVLMHPREQKSRTIDRHTWD